MGRQVGFCGAAASFRCTDFVSPDRTPAAEVLCALRPRFHCSTPVDEEFIQISFMRAGMAEPPVSVEVRRSARRRRTVSAYREGDRTVIVLIPARMSEAEESSWVAMMLEQARSYQEEQAHVRAEASPLGRPGGRSCPGVPRRPRRTRARSAGSPTRTPAGAPAPRPRAASGCRTACRGCPSTSSTTCSCMSAHLLVPGHGPRFWEFLQAYPRTERARGYLEGGSGMQRAGRRRGNRRWHRRLR